MTTRSLLATTLVILIYASIFISVLITDKLPEAPKNTNDLNLTQAWADLHVIAAGPHPYNSHANDRVRTFLLSHLKLIVHAHPHVHLADDLRSNGTWGNTYFEGTNILVKIDGTDPGQGAGAVLFSAHYDSVSTSTGTTDNGMAIVTLLQLVAKFAEIQCKRTAIFNFNNGEEDGLNGAHVFLKHPWSDFTTTFFNLEGAASGGRPLLFRATSATPLRAFLPPHVPHPHTNILAADAFAHGFIRSQTDYVVYANQGHMQGLDLAFYRGRSRYHTRYDAIPWLEGGESALWAMMETADGAGRALLNEENEMSTRSGGVVYFDLFGRTMILFSLRWLHIYNVAFLATVPIIVVGLWVYQRLVVVRPATIKPSFGWVRFWVALLLSTIAQAGLVIMYVKFNPYIIYSSPYLTLLSTFSLAYLTLFISLSLPLTFRRYRHVASNRNVIFWQLLIFSYILLFPTVLLRSPLGGTYPLSALATCAFLGWTIDSIRYLTLDQRYPQTSDGEEEGEPRLMPSVRFDPAEAESEDRTLAQEATENTPLIQHHNRNGHSLEDDIRRHRLVVEVHGVAYESLWVLQLLLVIPLPVILFAHVGVILLGSMPQTVVDRGPVWIVYVAFSALSMFLLIPLTPFLPSPSSTSSSARSTPNPSAPSQQLQSQTVALRKSTSFIAAIFLLSTFYTSGLSGITLTPFLPPDQRLGFPFEVEAPLKVFFQQKVEVVDGWMTRSKVNVSGVGDLDSMNIKATHTAGEMVSYPRDVSRIHTRAYTSLVGASGYVDKMILPLLPSALGATATESVTCALDANRAALLNCLWDSGVNMLPFPGVDGDDDAVWDKGNLVTHEDDLRTSVTTMQVLKENPWLKSSITRLAGNRVRIVLKGRNTRACRVYFDSGKATWRIVDGNSEGSEAREARMWSRTWGKEFVVDVEIEGKGEAPLSGRVACEWVEYESGLVGYGIGEQEGKHAGGRIPAYEEVLKFFPRWAVPTKAGDGLVEVWSPFQI